MHRLIQSRVLQREIDRDAVWWDLRYDHDNSVTEGAMEAIKRIEHQHFYHSVIVGPKLRTSGHIDWQIQIEGAPICLHTPLYQEEFGEPIMTEVKSIGGLVEVFRFAQSAGHIALFGHPRKTASYDQYDYTFDIYDANSMEARQLDHHPYVTDYSEEALARLQASMTTFDE